MEAFFGLALGRSCSTVCAPLRQENNYMHILGTGFIKLARGFTNHSGQDRPPTGFRLQPLRSLKES